MATRTKATVDPEVPAEDAPAPAADGFTAPTAFANPGSADPHLDFADPDD